MRRHEGETNDTSRSNIHEPAPKYSSGRRICYAIGLSQFRLGIHEFESCERCRTDDGPTSTMIKKCCSLFASVFIWESHLTQYRQIAAIFEHCSPLICEILCHAPRSSRSQVHSLLRNMSSSSSLRDPCRTTNNRAFG
jgi:hypothetical protein